jgi:hypothetical protein
MPAALYPFPNEYSWYSSLLEAEPIPEAIVRMEGIERLKKNPMTSSRIEPATFLLES